MMAAFLDTIGVPHDNGLITSELEAARSSKKQTPGFLDFGISGDRRRPLRGWHQYGGFAAVGRLLAQGCSGVPESKNPVIQVSFGTAKSA